MGTFVQATPTTVTGSNVSSLSGTFGNQTASGNLIVINAGDWASGAVAVLFNVPTDNAGNVYSTVAQVAFTNGTGKSAVGQWYKENISGSASHQITLTTASAVNMSLAALEYAGVKQSGSLSLTSANNAGTGTSPATNSVIPSGPATYVGVEADDGNTALSVTSGTERREINESNTSQSLSVAEKTGQGAQTITWTRSNDTAWASIVGTFLDALSTQISDSQSGLYRRDRAKAIINANNLI